VRQGAETTHLVNDRDKEPEQAQIADKEQCHRGKSQIIVLNYLFVA